MNKHTAGPWIAVDGHTIESVEDYKGFSSWIGTTDSSGANDESEDKANAEHIVHCVNTHDEMLAALKRAFNLIKESGFRSGLTEDEFDATLRQVGDVIAKAEGSTK